MLIRFVKLPPVDLVKIARDIQELFKTYEYEAVIDYGLGSRKYPGWVKIKKIRKIKSAPYCGSHPAACENPHGVRKRYTYLEGGDWVAVNDLINDVLDKYYGNAQVATSICIIRKGLDRRVVYGYNHDGREPQWNKDESDECYVNYCGKVAPASEGPPGTPGLEEYYERRNQIGKATSLLGRNVAS